MGAFWPGTLPRRAGHRRPDTQIRRPHRRLRGKRPARADRGHHDEPGQGGAHTADRARGVRAWRALGRRLHARPVGQAAAARPRRRVDPRLRAALDGRPARVVLGRACGADHADGERGAGGAGRHRPRSCGQGRPAVSPERRRRRQPGDDELEHRAGSHTGMGASRLPGPRRGRCIRAVVGRDRPRVPARRGRPRGGVVGARRQAQGRGDATERAPVRSHAPPWPGDRRDGRSHGVVGLDRGRLRDGRRHPPLPERAERGDLHHPGPAARRRSRHGDAAARGLRRP